MGSGALRIDQSLSLKIRFDIEWLFDLQFCSGTEGASWRTTRGGDPGRSRWAQSISAGLADEGVSRLIYFAHPSAKRYDGGSVCLKLVNRSAHKA